jgi:hypothetical protein
LGCSSTLRGPAPAHRDDHHTSSVFLEGPRDRSGDRGLTRALARSDDPHRRLGAELLAAQGLEGEVGSLVAHLQREGDRRELMTPAVIEDRFVREVEDGVRLVLA